MLLSFHVLRTSSALGICPEAPALFPQNSSTSSHSNLTLPGNITPSAGSTRMAVKKETGFFDLPGELRNEIYTLAFTGITTGIATPSKLPADYCVYQQHGEPQRLPGLLLASKRCYRESFGLFFACTTFVFTNPYNATIWLSGQRSRFVGCIKHFELQTWALSSDGGQYLTWLDKHEKIHTMSVFDARPRLGISESQVKVKIWSRDYEEVLWPKESSGADMPQPKSVLANRAFQGV